MKRKSTFLIFALLLSVCATLYSQTWTTPSLTGSTLTTGTTYYIYNVGSNGYLNRGGYWSMQSVVTALPTESASAAIIKWTAVNTSGSTWTFQYNVGGVDVTDKYLFAANADPVDGSVYTDNLTNNTWDVVLTDATAKTYSIQVVSTYGGYISTQYLGSASTTESTNRGPAITVRYNRASGNNYTQWKFVSQDDLDLYNARVLLDRYMNYAKIKGGIDISSYITTYDAGVTADINTAATNLLTALGRTSVTVPNYSFEDDAVQTGWTNNGSFANATNAPLFTKDATNYTEKYIASGSNLATGTITQTITGLANGVYGLVASGHAVQQSGGNPFHTGAFFTAGTSSTEISSGGDYNVDYAYVTNATGGGSDGTLTIGFALSGTVACNWTGFDNFRLYYYGPAQVIPPSSDATLSALTTSEGTLSPVFDPATLKYYVQLASGSAVPTVTPTANDAGATVDITNASAIPDTTIIKVTAEDGTTTKTYMVNFWDLKLTGTTIGHASSWNDNPDTYVAAAFDGITSSFVDAPTATGYVGLDLGEGKVAKLTSLRYFPRSGHTNRMVGGEIRGANNADLSDSVILYTITANPPVSYTDVLLNIAESYRYIYYYSANGYCNIAELEMYGVTTTLGTDASLSDLTVSGNTITGFASNNYTYDVELPEGTTVVPTVAGTATDAKANVVVTAATALPGATTVEVTAEDGTTKLTYTINFTVATNVEFAKTRQVRVISVISSDNIKVEFANKLGKISVYDISGRLVLDKTATKSSEEISVPGKGVYFIKTNVNGVVRTFKVVKN